MEIVQPIKDVKQLQTFLDFLKDWHYVAYVIFNVGIYSGLRVSDVLNLNTTDVCNMQVTQDTNLRKLEIKDFITIREQKTNKYKKFPISNKLKPILEEYLKNYRCTTYHKPTLRSEYKIETDLALFVTTHHLRQERVNIYNVINRAAKHVGITEPIGTHTMRKTFGYHFYKQTKDIVLLQKILNHSSPGITLRYIGVTEEDINRAYNSFDYIENKEQEERQQPLAAENGETTNKILMMILKRLEKVENVLGGVTI